MGQTLTPSPAAPAAGTAYREIDWQALLPKGWDLMAPSRGCRCRRWKTATPARRPRWRKRQFWRDAPIETALDGEAVRLPGFVVIAGRGGRGDPGIPAGAVLRRRIHVPPPPSNQVVHARAAKPLEACARWTQVWISGVMRVERAETMMGDAGYAMHDARPEPYQPAQPAR